MAGIGTKIKEALQAGHKRENVAYPGSDATGYNTASGYNTTSGNTAGYTEPGLTQAHAVDVDRGVGMGGDLLTKDAYPSATASEGVGGVRAAPATNTTNASGTVCETRTFTEVEDRPIMRERVERIIEHRPVEKQFVVETRPVGEREVTEGVHYESAGVREYEVDRVAGSKCPSGTSAGGVGHNTVL